MAAEQAHPAPSSPPERTHAVPLLLGVQLVTGIVMAPAFAFFPVYLKELGFSAMFISVIATLQRVAGLGSSLVGGELVGRLGAKRTLVGSQVVYFVGALLFLARGPWWIALVWVACGIGMGPFSLAGTTYLIEKSDRSRLGLFTALLYWGYTLGGAVGNPLAAALFPHTGWAGLVPWTAIPAVAIVVGTGLLLPGSGGREPSTERSAGILSALELTVASRAVRLLVVMRFLSTLGYGALTVFVPLLLKDAGASIATIALYGTATSVFASLAQLAVGRIGDRCGWKAPTAANYAALAASTLLIAVFPARLWIVFVAGIVAISACWSLSTLLPIQMTQAVEPSQFSRVLGANQLFWNVAMILASLVGGVLFEAWNGLPFLLGGVAAAAGLPVAAALARLTALSDPGRLAEADRGAG